MIIIQKTPEQIKQWIDIVWSADDTKRIDQFVRKTYSEACLNLEKQLRQENKHVVYAFMNTDKATTASIIHSSNRRKFALTTQYEIGLSLYQIRSIDRLHYEDILMEPLYPRYRTTLYDIYGVLYEDSYKDNSIPYRSSMTHTYRMQYDLLRKFRSRWESIFGKNASIPLRSFDVFHQAIHQMNSEQLRILFGTRIVFV